MNQVTISPNNEDTLLLVAVPKDIPKFSVTYIQNEPDLIGHVDGRNLQVITTLSQKSEYEIIGLLSSITEEQAKELGFKEGTDWRHEGIMDVPYSFSARTALIRKIESSGLTIGKDQDCLILKLN